MLPRSFKRLPVVVVTILTWVAPACEGPAVDAPPAGGARAPLFVEVAEASGLSFTHDNGARGEFFYPELMHPGIAFLDYDDDGRLDLYLIQGGPLPPDPGASTAANKLYRNEGDGTFEETTAAAGVADRGYGTGAAVADYDNDGDVDLYVTNLGANVLYRNNGDGTFTDVTTAAGAGDPGYSTAAAFVDYDDDGDLDLYVANYLDWSPGIERTCYAPNGLRDYCAPGVYEVPALDTLYRNDGDGKFTDVSVVAGVRVSRGQGLGVVVADFDEDGKTDIYVANDQMANFLWMNRGDGTFIDEALPRGTALNMYGRPEAGMGVTAEDVDGNGFDDLFMVHLDGETNTFYRNVEGFFHDDTDDRRLGAVSRPYTGFGTALFDYDCDSWYDIFIANGRVRLGETMAAGRYEEPNQLLRGGPDGTFEDVSNLAGDALALLEVSRGAAFGDYDDDGDIDIAMINNDGPVRLFRNEACGDRHWVVVKVVGRTTDRDGIGTRVTLEAGGRTRRREVRPAYSYGSSNDPRVHFGLGETGTIDVLTVTWPDGRRTTLTGVAADRVIEVVELGRESTR